MSTSTRRYLRGNNTVDYGKMVERFQLLHMLAYLPPLPCHTRVTGLCPRPSKFKISIESSNRKGFAKANDCFSCPLL